MIPFEVLVTSVHDRGDLLDRTLRSMLAQLDQRPARVLVHEDVRAGQPFVAGRTEALLGAIEVESGVPIVLLRQSPGTGLGHAVLRLAREARTEFVFYTQEDFDFLRPVPVSACLGIMDAFSLNHVRFNKRKTMAVKGADRAPHERWTKQEVIWGGQVLCVSDHFYFQGSLWRRSMMLDGFAVVCGRASNRVVDHCEVKFNDWCNRTLGGDRPLGCHDGEQDRRKELARTFIWGGVGEPAFIRHTGHDRRSQGWEERPRSRDS